MAPGVDVQLEAAESTQGTAIRVLRSGLWGLVGHAGYLLVSLLVTPFVIRRLGAEGYGLLALVNITAGYLAFADVGMGVASTRFGGQALASGDQRRESAVVWTSVSLLVVPLLGAAFALGSWAPEIARNILDIRGGETASAAEMLRLASIIMVATALAGVLNTSAVVRLRNEVMASISFAASVVQGALTIIVLSSGGGLRGVGVAVAAGACVGAAGHLVAALRLCPAIRRPEFRRDLVAPLCHFGGSVMLAAVLTAVIQNSEKFLVLRLVSVRDLAYYNVAFTLAGLASLFGAIASQPFMPAFVLKLGRGERDSVMRLYEAARRGTILLAGPVVLAAALAGGPFLRIWAGRDFQDNGFAPLCILLVGSAFSLASRLPQGLLLAAGHVDVSPRLHAALLVPYLAATFELVRRLGPLGAAVAWTARSIVDYWVYSIAASDRTGTERHTFGDQTRLFGTSLVLLVGPVVLVWASHPDLVVAAPVAAASLGAYGRIAWARLLSDDERSWVRSVAALLIQRRLFRQEYGATRRKKGSRNSESET